MCGIAAALALDGSLDQRHAAIVAGLNQWQAHRGPDGEGLWTSDDHAVILGHRRLAIIDTGAGGAQPMTDVTGRWTITLNGEIYNYRAIKRELEAHGRRFATNSDTEVLINAIAQWGEGALTRLRGMFAFAMWDRQEKEFWLARDPYGIKPLYTAQTGSTLWVASQARALAECTPVTGARDAAALVGFYLWGSVPEPFSWWAEIRPLPAGHIQRISPGNRNPGPRQYYSVPDHFAAQPPVHASPEFLRGVLTDSVEHHLVADTDVGVFLSAGLDSNVIASLASTKAKKLKTITLAFREYENTPDDEAPVAELAAKAIGSDHITVRIGREEFDALLPDFFRKMDQPTIDGLNTYLISRAAAKQGLKVALSGLGGDELFGGYPSFRQIPRLLRLGRAVPGLPAVGRFMERASRELLPELFSSKLMSVFSHSGNILDAYLLRRCVYLREALELVVDQGWLDQGLARLREAAAQEKVIKPLHGGPVRAQIAALESCCYLRNQLLRDADWAGMAHSVEIRVPFVDRVVLESLGPAVASSRPPRKSDLASVLANLPAALQGRRKTGFSTPARQWATGEADPGRRGLEHWANLVARIMRKSPTRGMMEQTTLARGIAGPGGGMSDHLRAAS
jgi:asparagine synthase (glutamine-hydrolysing)